MPNHVTNEIRIIGTESRVAEFFKQAHASYQAEDMFTKAVTTEDAEFSFRGFVRPPEHPDYNSGGCSHPHWDYRLNPEKDPHSNCWYTWNVQNWGTKWDCYDVKIGSEKTILDRLARVGDDGDLVEETVQFDTAWSAPFPVFKKICELYPDCKFEFRWMDEDMQGSGGGIAKAEDGELVDLVDGLNDPSDVRWWQLARDLKHYTQEQHDDYLAELAEDERLAADPLGLRHGLSGERSASE